MPTSARSDARLVSTFRSLSICASKFRVTIVPLLTREGDDMENNYKLKMKIGDHEFEAEGPVDVVQAQFADFRDLIAKLPATPTSMPFAAAEPQTIPAITAAATSLSLAEAARLSLAEAALKKELGLDKIMRTEGRVISLTARGSSLEDEIL